MASMGIKTSTLLLGSTGVVLLLLGLASYAAAGRLQAHAHLLLPLPPIAVAAYVYGLNRFAPLINAQHDKATLLHTARDVLIGAGFSGMAFFVISALMLLLILLWKALSH